MTTVKPVTDPRLYRLKTHRMAGVSTTRDALRRVFGHEFHHNQDNFPDDPDCVSVCYGAQLRFNDVEREEYVHVRVWLYDPRTPACDAIAHFSVWYDDRRGYDWLREQLTLEHP